jgi:hypothetical protein
MGINPDEGLAQYEDRYVKKGVGIQMDKLNPEESKEAAEEIRRRKTETALKKRGEDDDFPVAGLRRKLTISVASTKGRLAGDHSTVVESVQRSVGINGGCRHSEHLLVVNFGGGSVGGGSHWRMRELMNARAQGG